MLAVLLLTWASAALAAEQSLLLELVLNGRRTGQVREFTNRDGVIYAKSSDLVDLGFVVRAKAEEEVALSKLPGVQASINPRQQTLVVTASDDALAPSAVGQSATSRLVPLTPSTLGAVLNYDASATDSGRTVSGGVLLDGRVFGPDGVFQGGALVNFSPTVGQSALVRLNDTYTFSQPDALRRWRIGDVLTGALSWTRAVQLGGVQVATDFTMRSDLITYPLPMISGAAAVPSTVDVVANGVHQFSQAVQPGPFQVSTLPVVTGAGEVAVTVKDALGRETLITMPFYASSSLLKPGLVSYSLEAGSVRRDYGLASSNYAGWAANGSVRYGLTDALTLEGHSEAAGGLALLGGGVVAQAGSIGVVNAAMAVSDGRGEQNGGAQGPDVGALITAGFQRQSRSLSFNIGVGLASAGYHDIASVNGSPMPRVTLNAGIGYQLGRFGSVGLSYVSQQSGQPGQSGQSSLGLTPAPLGNVAVVPNIKLISASYSVPIFGRFSIFASAYKDLLQSRGFGAGVGVSFRMGKDASVSLEAARAGAQSLVTAQVDKPALVENQFGYRLQDSEGSDAARSLEVEYLSPWARVSAGVDQTDGQVSTRVGALGAVVLAGGGLFASDQIEDSFAVVKAGNLPKVPVLYENRPVGLTDAQGVLLVPFLRSFENNKLSIDALSLPVDVEMGQASVIVRPSDRSGIVVDFHIKRVEAALVKLRDAAARPVPLGSIARVKGAPDVPVGYDGDAYVTGLTPHNRMDVETPDGKHCVAVFDYTPVKGDIPVIGPIVCRAGGVGG